MTFDEYKRFFASTNNAGEGKDAGGRVGDYEVRTAHYKRSGVR